jgi:hypothetical protein
MDRLSMALTIDQTGSAKLLDVVRDHRQGEVEISRNATDRELAVSIQLSAGLSDPDMLKNGNAVFIGKSLEDSKHAFPVKSFSHNLMLLKF